MRILLIEDDELLGDAVKAGLVHFDYIVDWVKDGVTAEAALSNETFDMIVLDIGLPRMTGLELLRRIRRTGNMLPVLILTANDAVDDRVKGLDSGADDYMTKPFDLDELCARLRALQRRTTERAAAEIHYKNIILDPAAHSVTVDGEPVDIPRREFMLFHKLLENAGRVLSREQLTQTLYGWDENVDSNALEVHIHYLRKRFGSEFIRTIRGVGYMINKSS